MNTTGEGQKRGRRVLGILVACFLAPLAGAFWLYYGAGWRPARTVQHGELVSPALPLPAVSLPLAAGGASDDAFLRGKWSIVYVGGGDCGAHCRQALDDARRVRLALDQDRERVQRVFLHRGACCDDRFAREQPDLVVAGLDVPAAAMLLASFDAAAKSPALSAGRLYLVDPLGNLMMSYAADAPARDVLRDLERLLKLSHIG